MKREPRLGTVVLWCSFAFSLLVLLSGARVNAKSPAPAPPQLADTSPAAVGCLSCHTQTDSSTMHSTETVKLSCVDCHGGDGQISAPSGLAPDSAEYKTLKSRAHVLP